MNLFDLPLAELERYRPEIAEPSDFDAFWADTIAVARSADTVPARFERVDTGLRSVETFDVTFPGFDGQPIRGWLQLPAGADGPLPCVVTYIGYGGGRSLPADHLVWASAGYAHLVMDTRGQGSTWSPSDTADAGVTGEPQAPGVLTRGIEDPARYYYRRLMTDAVRAVDAAKDHPAVDAARVAVGGGSQGGGLALAVAGLRSDLRAAVIDVPFLCHFRRASEITDKEPYVEIANWCRVHRERVDTAFRTLDYFDGVHFASRASAPALFSVALMDEVCPPSTVYAAYNRYAGPKRINVWPYNGHEGGGAYQTRDQLAFLAEHLA
jgi:cephalosporin-C deacetylase